MTYARVKVGELDSRVGDLERRNEALEAELVEAKDRIAEIEAQFRDHMKNHWSGKP